MGAPRSIRVALPVGGHRSADGEGCARGRAEAGAEVVCRQISSPHTPHRALHVSVHGRALPSSPLYAPPTTPPLSIRAKLRTFRAKILSSCVCCQQQSRCDVRCAVGVREALFTLVENMRAVMI